MSRISGAVYHALVLTVLGMFLSLLIVNLRRLRRLESEPGLSTEKSPSISVLIPARNEARNLPRSLESLLGQDYPRFDITVLDDDSTDATAEVVQPFVKRDSRLRLVHGKPLPEGWAGKPWACQQLSEQSEADILLFVDADTWVEPDTLSRTAGLMQREGTDLFSVIPHQVTGTVAERLVIPGLYLAFLCGMPLWRVDDPRYPEIAAANGQFMCFKAESYRQVGGHAAVKDQVIEDLAFARTVKRAGYRLSSRTALETVHCRMYRSWREVLDGFSKSAYGVFGERPDVAAGYVALMAGTHVVPPLLCLASILRRETTISGLWLPMVETLLGMLLRLLMSRRMRFRQSDAVMAPLTALAAIVVTFRSIWLRYRGGYQWKERRYERAALW